MIARCSYDFKPIDPRLTVQRHINWFDPKADVVWMTSEEFSKKTIIVHENAENVPKEIKRFIPKWREKALEVMNTRSDFCPIKRASSNVYYKGEKYSIDTGILYDIGNAYTVDWLFETIARDIESDMYSIGAIYVEYLGMVD